MQHTIAVGVILEFLAASIIPIAGFVIIMVDNCYCEFVEKEIGFPITMVSNGPGRNDIIYRNK